jgi:hypothetical protein
LYIFNDFYLNRNQKFCSLKERHGERKAKSKENNFQEMPTIININQWFFFYIVFLSQTIPSSSPSPVIAHEA